MKRLLLAAAFALAFTGSASAAGQPGRFDYWLLSLSWSPQYCATTQKADTAQCGARRYGFVVHGLWPQYERGFPSDCGRASYLPDSLIDRMLPIMPSKPLILHEWRKHGVCSGLDADGYFEQVGKAYRSVTIPESYRRIDRPLSLAPQALESTLMAANPNLRGAGIALECRGPYLSEVRICFDRSLNPRNCGRDVEDRCGASVVLRPIR